MKHHLLYLLSPFLLLSCAKPEVEKLLTHPDKKWVYIENVETLSRDYSAYAYMKFDKNNHCENRLLETDTKPPSHHGNDPECIWHYHEEGEKLHIYDFKFTVTKYSADTIYLKRDDGSPALLINKRK